MGFRWWPWPRRRSDPKIDEAAAEVTVSASNLEAADKALDEAREMSEWAKEANSQNRFDIRLRAAYRTHPGQPR